MSKPGRWRLSLEQLDQATTQIVASPDTDAEAAELALDNLYALYQWASVMSSHELHTLNGAILRLSTVLGL